MSTERALRFDASSGMHINNSSRQGLRMDSGFCQGLGAELRGCRTGSDRLAELPGTLLVVTSRQRISRHTEKDKPAGAERKTWRERAYNHFARVLHAVAVAHSLHSGAPNNESSPARCCTVSVSQCESCSSDYFDGALRASQHYSINVPSCIEDQRGKG